MRDADVIVIGRGIVGLATAYSLARGHGVDRVLVLEKETEVARHQSGHNSGVLHTGIYYKPGSLKARNCTRGKLLMEAFCRAHDIDYEICGKVVVATCDAEREPLAKVTERARANGVECELIGPDELARLEPHANGVEALHVPKAGVVDYVAVCHALVAEIRACGGDVRTGARVARLAARDDHVEVGLDTGVVLTADQAVNCGGLHCDRILRWAGGQPEGRIIPFRGEYYLVKESAADLCRTLIYPVPDPRFPFLGVHFTRDIHDVVECGPNAVLAFAREGYRKTDVVIGDLLESLTYPGFLRLAARYWRTGCGEMWRSISKAAFVKALQRLVPDVREEHLEPAPAGVRAQAVTREGRLLDDFSIVRTPRMVHVNNAPSPAATSSLSIGETVAEMLL